MKSKFREFCVRCNINQPIFNELVCEECLEWLRIQNNIPEGEDPLEYEYIQDLLRSYKTMDKKESCNWRRRK